MQEGNTFIHHSAISILFYYMILPPTFNQSQRVWCVFFSFFTENRVHSQAFYHINYMNLKRRTTETFLRSFTPTMMVIIRQGLQKIFRCSLGIVRLCLSFFLWLCQFIMGRNDQIRPKAVEHNYFQGETSFLSTCDKITCFLLAWL